MAEKVHPNTDSGRRNRRTRSLFPEDNQEKEERKSFSSLYPTTSSSTSSIHDGSYTQSSPSSSVILPLPLPSLSLAPTPLPCSMEKLNERMCRAEECFALCQFRAALMAANQILYETTTAIAMENGMTPNIYDDDDSYLRVSSDENSSKFRSSSMKMDTCTRMYALVSNLRLGMCVDVGNEYSLRKDPNIISDDSFNIHVNVLLPLPPPSSSLHSDGNGDGYGNTSTTAKSETSIHKCDELLLMFKIQERASAIIVQCAYERYERYCHDDCHDQRKDTDENHVSTNTSRGRIRIRNLVDDISTFYQCYCYSTSATSKSKSNTATMSSNQGENENTIETKCFNNMSLELAVLYLQFCHSIGNDMISQNHNQDQLIVQSILHIFAALVKNHRYQIKNMHTNTITGEAKAKTSIDNKCVDPQNETVGRRGRDSANNGDSDGDVKCANQNHTCTHLYDLGLTPIKEKEDKNTEDDDYDTNKEEDELYQHCHALLSLLFLQILPCVSHIRKIESITDFIFTIVRGDENKNRHCHGNINIMSTNNEKQGHKTESSGPILSSARVLKRNLDAIIAFCDDDVDGDTSESKIITPNYLLDAMENVSHDLIDLVKDLEFMKNDDHIDPELHSSISSAVENASNRLTERDHHMQYDDTTRTAINDDDNDDNDTKKGHWDQMRNEWIHPLWDSEDRWVNRGKVAVLGLVSYTAWKRKKHIRRAAYNNGKSLGKAILSPFREILSAFMPPTT